MRRIRLLASMVVVLGSTGTALASLDDANSTLGFESVANWTARNGAVLATSTNRTQGAFAVSVQTQGYTVLTSRLLGPLGQVSQSISFDLGLPSTQASGWAGATQLFVSIPSLNVYNAYVGQVELTGLPVGKYNRVAFRVPDDLLAKLRGTYYDATFSIVLNVPGGAQNPYLLDNLIVSPSIPANTTIGLQERSTILGFESQTPVWTITSGSLTGLVWRARSQGNFSLGFVPNGYCVLTSPPLPSLAPVSTTLSFDLALPSPRPTWGAAQLLVSIPSQNVNNAYLGQVDLTTLPVLPAGAFNTLSFSVPSWLTSQLGAQYTDLRFSIALNVPSNDITYYIDNFKTGPITTPTAALPPSWMPSDLTGSATSGLATFSYDGVVSSVNITKASFYVEEEDKACVPTSAQVCKYLVRRISLATGAVAGSTITSATVENAYPFEVPLGGNGPSSLSSPLLASVPFYLTTNVPGLATKVFPGSNSTITISPSGAGMIAMSGQFSGILDGKAVVVSGAVTADSPLTNRPPSANAGPDQTVTTSQCIAVVTLAGSSSDPDNNVLGVRWFDSNNKLVGTGYTPKVKILHPGAQVLTLEVVDIYGSRSTDQVVINATLGSSCTTTPPPPPPIILL
jgi:hypothetical protein